MKLIGKNIADNIGLTKFLDGELNSEKIHITTEINDREFKALKQEIQNCNTTVEIDTVVKEQGLEKIEGLSDYLKELYSTGNLDKLNINDINKFAINQRYVDIADQAHGFKGINTAIKEYKKLTDDASRSKFRDAIKNTNHSLADYLSNLGQADAGIMGYGKSLAIATAKTIGLQAATTVLNAAVSMGISLAIQGLITGIDYLIHKEEKQAEALEEAKNKFDQTTDEIKSLNDELKTTQEKIEELEKLKDAGAISVADENELKTLKETNDELERKIALEKKDQIDEANDLLKKAQDSNKDTTYDTFHYNDEGELVHVRKKGNASEKLEDMLAQRKDAIKEYGKDGINEENYDEAITKQAKTVDKLIESYNSLRDAGVELTKEQQEEYDQAIKAQQAYILYTYQLNKNKEAFVALTDQQKRSIIYDKLIENGMDDKDAKAVSNQIPKEELDDYYDLDFNFPLPKREDYATAEGYGKAYAEAWKRGVDNTLEDANTKSTEPKTFSQVWKSIGKTGTDEQKKAAKEAKEEILELAKAGKLTQEKLKKSPIADEFDKAGISIYEATKKINKFAEASDQLATMGKGMSSITGALDEKQTNLSDKKTRTKGVKSETLAGFDAEIKGLESWDEFERTLGNGKKSMEQCRRAANKLATEWVSSNNFLANLDETKKDYYISSLNNMGVENGEAIVTEMLAQKRQEEAQANADAEAQAGALAITKNGVTAETVNEVDALFREKGASDELKYSIVDTIAKENIFSNTSLSVDQKVEALRKLIEKFYEGSDAAKDFMNKIKNGEDYQTAFDTTVKDNEPQQLVETLNPTPIIEVQKPSQDDDDEKKKKTKKQKKQKESKQEFDWMERKVTVLNNKLSETEKLYDAIAASMKKADSSALVRKENANLKKQYRLLRKLRSAYGKQEKKYQSQANKYAKKNLSKDLQNKVKNGKIKGSYSKLVKEYGQTKADKIQTAIGLYDKASTARQNKVDASKQIRDNEIQQHQNRADLAQTRLDKNAARAELEHLSKKNKYIDNQIKYTKNLYDHQIAIAKLNRDSEEVARLEAEKQKEIRDFKIEKLQNLADEKEESYNLYKTQASMATNYKEKNKLGKNGIEQLKKQYDYLIKIAKEEGNVTEQKRLQLEKTQEINEASKERIQNVSEDYENRLIGNSRQMQAWNNAASLAEAKGKTINADFYNQMATVAGQEEKKRKDAVDDAWETYWDEMKNNPNFINSPQWYDAIQTINDAYDAYEQAQISAEQYKQKAVQANWGIADSARQAIEYLNDEAETYKTIFGYKDMYDKDGKLTDAGTATFALDVYGIENNAETIRKVNGEIDDLNKLYKDGKISVEQYDKRMQELRENALNAAESIYSLRDGMKSLIEEGLNAEMDALNESIDKVKKNLSDASSLREYQKNIEKQTKNIASLERQINAKSGDMSEKGRSDLQKLKVQLEDARSELEDTEYDKYIEDQERILDDMADDFQKYLDAQLDQVDRLLQGIIDSIKNGNVNISETIKQVGKTIGVDLSKVLTDSLDLFATTGKTNAGDVYDNTANNYKDSADGEYKIGEAANIMNTDEKKGTVQTNGQASNPASNNTSTWQQGTVSEDLKKEFLASTNTHFNSSSTDTLKPVSAEKERKSSNSKNMGNIMKVLARVRKKDKDKEGSKPTLSNYGSQKFANKYGKGENKYLSMENVKKADNYVKKLVDVKTGKPMYDTSTGAKTYKALLTLNGKYGGVFGDAVKNRKATIPVGGFSKGGIVDTSTLSKIAKDNGDDAWVTVKSGEGILNPMDTKNLEALTDSLKNIRHPSAGILDSKNIVPNNVNANRNMYGDINVHLDGSNVIDPKSFVKTVQSSREARNVILDVFASATTNDTMAYMRR